MDRIDLGHAQAFDFTLGQCEGCGKYWMQLTSDFSREVFYLPMTAMDAERLLGLRPGSERKAVLSAWMDGLESE